MVLSMLNTIKNAGYTTSYDYLLNWYLCFYEHERDTHHEGYVYFLEVLAAKYDEVCRNV